MEIDYKKILTGLLSKAYKLDNGKIEELFTAENATAESIENLLLETDTQRVSQLKGMNADNKDSFNQGYAKATKETREKFENDLKAEYGITSEAIGLDLIKEIVSATAGTGAGTGGKEITEDDVKKHPAFLQMERTFKNQLTEKETEHANKITELENATKKNETFYNVRQKAIDQLASLKPIESKNPTVASTLKNTFIESLKGYDYEVQSDGSLLVLKDGKRYDDQHGHAVSFDDIVKQIAGNFYDFEGNNGGANAGNENQEQRAGAAAAVKTFKTQEEADKYASDATIPLKERIDAMAAFTNSQKERANDTQE